MKTETMMKWRVRRQSKCSTNSEVNEDVRRSLEILDNVLAEFDDHDVFSSSDSILVNGDEQESQLSHAHQEKERWEDENGNKLQQNNVSYYSSSNGQVSPELQSLDSSTGGTTSQPCVLLDESRRCSAPPVPKRSPGTRLSNRDRLLFSKEEEDDEVAQIHASRHSLSCLQLTSQNGEHAHKIVAEGKRKAALSVPTPGTSTSSSPVDDNAQISNRLRHGKITDDLCLEFFLVRSGDNEDAADDDVFVSPPRRDMKCITTTCLVCGGNLDHSSAMASVPPGSRGTRQFPTDSAKAALQAEAHLRRMRLDKKFAKVKLLLQTNQITGLDKPPPSFKPPPLLPPPQIRVSDKAHVSPPPQNETNSTAVLTREPHKELEKTANNKSPLNELPIKQRPRVGSTKEVHSAQNDAKKMDIPLEHERINAAKPPNGLPSRDIAGAKCEQGNSGQTSDHQGGELNHICVIKMPTENRDRDSDKAPANQNLMPADFLCKNCINKGWSFRTSEFVTSSPSPLKRPPLGLSYSMEDDLSPGIKEISGSPKTIDGQSDSLLSSPKSSPVTHMSTFSHSASSLGDGSSQSDLDFSNSVDSGKVPLTSIKSLTLPTDMKLGPSPFYSAMEGEHLNGTKLGVSGLDAMRSSSAPPPPQDKGHWKKDKTGFSRKEQQNKNDAVDSSRQTEEEEVTSEEKPKKRSVWKSILRRK